MRFWFCSVVKFTTETIQFGVVRPFVMAGSHHHYLVLEHVIARKGDLVRLPTL